VGSLERPLASWLPWRRAEEIFMSTRVRMVLAAACFATLGVTIACSDHPGTHASSKSQQDLEMCFGDSGYCIDADIPGFDGGFPGFPDAGGFPGFPDSGFGFGVDAEGPFFGYCGWDPKYVTEYDTQVMTFTVKPCFMGCAATECCYLNLSCVAQ
jgi:hypothetical protein